MIPSVIESMRSADRPAGCALGSATTRRLDPLVDLRTYAFSAESRQFLNKHNEKRRRRRALTMIFVFTAWLDAISLRKCLLRRGEGGQGLDRRRPDGCRRQGGSGPQPVWGGRSSEVCGDRSGGLGAALRSRTRPPWSRRDAHRSPWRPQPLVVIVGTEQVVAAG